jgi:hypothetical protein
MSSFAQASMPDAFRVAGMRLRPHCLGHALLLQRLSSPWAGRPVSPAGFVLAPLLGDLTLAVFICQRSPSAALAQLRRKSTPLGLSIAAWRIARPGLETADAELRAYLLAAWPEIEWWKSPDRTRTLGADLLQSLVLTQRRLGATLEGAMNIPLAVALWDQAAEAERQGALSLVSDADRVMMEQARLLDAAGLLPRPGTVVRRN